MDNDQFDISQYKWLIPVAISILMISLILVKCSGNTLQDYTDSSSRESSSITDSKEDSSEITINEETNQYANDKMNFSLSIPASWAKINGKDENISFVDKKTSLTLYININAYDPTINNINENSISLQAENAGYSLNEFKKEKNNNYSVAYNDNKFGYVENYYWDKNNIIMLKFQIPINLYNDTDINNKVKFIANSFNWETENPIPENIFLKYYETGNFEFGFIKGWNYGESSNTILSTNKDNTASISITVEESNQDLSQVSQVEYSTNLSQSKNNLIINTFNNDGTTIKCTGSYTQDDQNVNLQQYIIASGQYIYTISFDSYNSVTSELSTDFQNVINSFRYFR